jgi:1-acyl-sn-glycerol-3-phosphate acyltransferase
VLPVAHNAGELWRRRAFIKRPGVVTVSIGAPIDTRSLTPDELIRKVEDWIEREMQRIGNPGRPA